jgi:hypothetical protein
MATISLAGYQKGSSRMTSHGRSYARRKLRYDEKSHAETFSPVPISPAGRRPIRR